MFFEGVCSLSDKYVSWYLWDFGDGGVGYGKEINHTYARTGFYNVTFTVQDINGKTVSDKTAAYIYPVDLLVDIDTLPSQAKYDYGDSLEGVDSTVSYPDNRDVGGLRVFGELSGRQMMGLSFQEARKGLYHAEASYPILKEDGIFLDVYVNATDEFSNSGVGFRRLILVSNDTGFEVVVDKPVSWVFAPGQVVHLEARFVNSGGRQIEEGNLTLYEGWARKSFPFTRVGDVYRLEYQIPRDVRPRCHLYIYAHGLMDSREYQAYKDVDVNVVRNLSLDLVYPRPGPYSPDIDKIKLNITYPNGEVFGGGSISATIGGRSVLLKKADGLFVGDYRPGREERTLKIKVTDEFGNAGEAEFLIFDDQMLDEYRLGILVAMIALTLLALFIMSSGRSLYYGMKSRKALREEYDTIAGNIRALKRFMEELKGEYYSRKITEEDLRHRTLDYEKEIAFEKANLRIVLERMGLPKKEAEGKEELIMWLVEKLEDGEDAEELRKALKEAGAAGLVDRVRKVFSRA